MEKTKRPEITHNTTKIKALLFLEMRLKSVRPYATARDIARAITGNAKSLYILLERWERWELVRRNYDDTPYSYALAAEGQRYLSKIDAWFFSGYYSRKRKRRVLGYRGKAEALKLEIAIAAKAVFMTYDTKRAELFYFEAPFTKAENFVREPIIGNRYKRWDKDRLLLTQCDTVVDAFTAIGAICGLNRIRPMGQAIVDAGIGVSWKQDEKQ